MMSAINPRFVSYAKYHGRGANGQLAHDKKRYPGGCMAGFICWISKMKAMFRKERPELFLNDVIVNQQGWTDFLAAKAEEKAGVQ